VEKSAYVTLSEVGQAIELAVDEINAAGGFLGKHLIQLFIRDTRTDQETAAVVNAFIVDILAKKPDFVFPTEIIFSVSMNDWPSFVLFFSGSSSKSLQNAEPFIAKFCTIDYKVFMHR